MVVRTLRVGFMNIEDLQSILQNRDFLDLFEEIEMTVLAESWMG